MIINVINENIFETNLKHIAYSINTQGYNDGGFAGQVADIVPSLKFTGDKKLGEIISVENGKHTFHALVCHSLKEEGWSKSPEAIVKCLDAIKTDEEIAVVLMGSGMIGMMTGADVKANVRAIQVSKKKCTVYTLQYTQKAIMDCLG